MSLSTFIVSLSTFIVSLYAQEIDYGYIGACEKPSLFYCHGITFHAVPASIARQASFVEFSVDFWARRAIGTPRCKKSLKRALCKQRFPACSQLQNTVTFEADSNCEVDLLGNCYNLDKSVVIEICSNKTIPLYLGSCQTLNYHMLHTGPQLQACNEIPGETELTDWMFRFLTLMNSQIMRDSSSDLQEITNCYLPYVKYRCDFGHCDNHQVKSTNTKALCEESVLGW